MKRKTRDAGHETIALVSLGCAKNAVDLQVRAGNLLKRGCVLSTDPDRADTVIVNTCSFIESARAEAEMRAAEALVVLAFPLLTFGLGSGALWADEAWGAYWSWDIKETWALLTWCLYLIWFHLRRRTPLLSRRPLLILAWVAVLITFLVVNLLPKIVSLHSYAA